MEIDVRNTVEGEIDVIRFADDEQNIYYQSSIIRHIAWKSLVHIEEGGNGEYVRITSKQHALDLIKALEKAIELGWLE